MGIGRPPPDPFLHTTPVHKMRNRPANSNLEPNAVVAPRQLAMMAQVMEAYCVAFAIDDPLKRAQVGYVLMQLLVDGASSLDDLSNGLDEHIGKGLLR